MLPDIKVKIGADTSGLEKGIVSATSSLGKFAKQAAIALGVAGAAGGFVAMTKAAIDNADALNKASQKMGIAVEALSRLQYAAKLSDVSLEGLQTGMNALSRQMAAGSDSFKALGIAVTNSDGTLRSSLPVLGEIADRFAQIPDGATKTALALDIFGRSGAELIPLLNQGSAGLADMAREADNVGATISGSTAAAAEQFNDTLTKIGATVGGVFNKIASEALPALQGLADTLASPEFAQAASQFAQAVIGGLNLIAQTATGVSNLLNNLFGTVGQKTSEWLTLSAEMNRERLGRLAQDTEEYKKLLAETMAMEAELNNRNPGLLLASPYDQASINQYAGIETPGVPVLPGAGGSDAEAERQKIADRLAVIQEGFLTEAELVDQKYADDLQTLNDAFANELLTRQEHQAAVEQLEQQHANKLSAIRAAANAKDLQAMGQFFGAVGSIMEQGGGEMLGIAKAFGAAQALINSYVAASQALADPTVPFWGKAAAFASMVATGLSAVNAIKGVSKGGGGGSPAAASTSDTSAAMAMNRTVTVQGLNPGQIFSGDAMRDFMEQLLQMQRDGYQVVLA